VSKQVETAGWYRIAKYNELGATAESFIVNIDTRYNSNENMSVTLNVNLSYKKATITNLSSNIRYSVVNKVRVVQEEDATYLEIYYRHSVKNFVFVEILNQGSFSILNFEAPTDSATVLHEINIPDELNISSLLVNGWELQFISQCFKKGDVVHLCAGFKKGTATTILTLPEGYRPANRIQLPIVAIGATGILTIETTGEVSCNDALAGYSTSALYVNGTYKV
ncbi:MAG: hypothetical protein IJ272_06790, partial [Clostridia bacterium]|nr:hypothetical protein [Clostridia bacterium]